MSEKKRERRGRFHVANDVHLFDGDVENTQQLRASCEVDAARDREWFRLHPKETARSRPVSVREMLAMGLPPEAVVVVVRGPHGSQIRIFPKRPLSRVPR